MTTRTDCSRKGCGHTVDSHHEHVCVIDNDDGTTSTIRFRGRCSARFCACFDYCEPRLDDKD